MYKNILLLIAVFVMAGCSAKKEECKVRDKSDFGQLFTKDDIFHNSLINTQKAQLIASFETKALLTATYLNPVFEERNCKKRFLNKMQDAEYFFIGVYIQNSEKHKFNTKGYSLTLNGLAPIEVIELENDDPLRYEMPMVDNWSTYYKVKFKKSPTNDFTLIFENDRFGKDILNYSKGEKPLFESLVGSNK
ncbi:MAG: Unknown protein [uncultured Sulfurovum sp.]|uniref:Lipoprotein n=1 Tax=uncultured Sulfurovum sp. TaxID=269237 RepID=A0A6S6TLU7_9BACT|nr:MAG: Unknown protein [uncultured Sulfurovum sp.]